MDVRLGLSHFSDIALSLVLGLLLLRLIALVAGRRFIAELTKGRIAEEVEVVPRYGVKRRVMKEKP